MLLETPTENLVAFDANLSKTSLSASNNCESLNPPGTILWS